MWAERTLVVWSGRMSNTAGAPEKPGVVETESARLTQIKHKEIEPVFALRQNKHSLHGHSAEKLERDRSAETKKTQ